VGQIAGITVQRILNEPTAADVACDLDQKKTETVLILDLGGTFLDSSR
jgi:molecular chaperone DnaK